MGSQPTSGTQVQMTNQNQQQQGRSESQPNSFVNGMLKGIAGQEYNLYTGMPGGNPVPDQSANTNAYQAAALAQAQNGPANLGALPSNFVANTLNGNYLNLSSNPYYQAALTTSLAAPTENFMNNVVPGLLSTFASQGRTDSGSANSKLNELVTNFGRSTNEAAAQMGNQAYQFERGQQSNALAAVPGLNSAQLANLSMLGQAGQQQDAYQLMQNMGPFNFANMAGMGILGAYPGGVTDSSGWSTGNGSTYGYGTPAGGGAGSWLGAGLGLASLGLQAAGPSGFGWIGPAAGAAAASDRRDKTDIEELGIDPLTGLKTYAYRYKDDPKNTPKVVGPMAQDVEKVRPDLVRAIGGHKVVHPAAMGRYAPRMPVGGLM